MKTLFLLLLSFASYGQILTVPATANLSGVPGAATLIRSIDANVNTFQREDIPFTVTNTSNGTGVFTWRILDLVTKSIVTTSTESSPTFTLEQGYYVLYAEVQGLNPDPVARVFWNKQLTVLPRMFTEGEADRVLTLGTGNNIYDATSWADGEDIFLKKSGAAVGRIRIDNYTSATKAHLLIDPSSEMEVNTFAGSHGLYLVNCQNLLIDAVGTTDAYGLYLNGIGDNTSHALTLNLVSDIRCSDIEIYGVKIAVPQSGASGVRMLGDESATYNRNDPPLENFKFAHFWVVESGHEALYAGYTDDTDGGFGGPRQFKNLWAWDWIVDDSGRDAIQPCNQIDFIIHDWVINSSGTLGEPSHNSYISSNAGNQNGKIFNIRAKGGIHAISHDYGFTGTNPMYWNMIMEVETLPSQSSWNFMQVGSGPTTDMTVENTTIIANTGDEIVWRFDSDIAQGSMDVDDFTLINNTTIKGTSANFFTKDGTNAETNWDRTSGNLTYIPATAATALLHATTHAPSSVSCPSINGGVSWAVRRTYDDFLGDFGTLEFQYDINGYIIGLDGDYSSGADGGIELKLNALLEP